MKRSFQRMAALLLACLTLASSAALAAEDYTVAEKLVKQLWAGSGFSGELSVSFDTPALRTKQPIRADVDYIYVRPTERSEAEHRLDLRLEDGSAASAQLTEGALAFQADVLSPDWYVLRADGADESAAGQALQSGAGAALGLTGMPEVTRTALALAARLGGSDAVQEALEPYQTRVDVWIEGYRQDALLDKLADGTTTMEVNYRVSPAAVKAQVKQMILDLLADAQLLTALTDAMGEEATQRYVNPALQSWYFAAVDALPLSDDMTISRTFSMKGDTLNLSLCLPLYDAQTGAVTLSYDRQRGLGDLPDENVIRLESEDRTLSLHYQEYSSMTGVKVLQGRVENRASESFEVDEADASAPATDYAADFTLKQERGETRDSEGRDVYTYNLSLNLQPEAGQELEASLISRFASKELKSAATEMDASLTVRRGQSSVTAALNGASRKKWEPDALPFERTDVSTLTQTDLTATLAGAGVRLLAALADCVEVPEADAEPSEAPAETEAPSEAPTETEAPTEEPAKTETPTEVPTETEAPTEEPAKTEAPTEAPTEMEAPTEEPAETEAPTETPASTANP